MGFNVTARRAAAAGIALALLALVICDLSIRGFRAWWGQRSLTASIVSSLLVLGVTALIVDEVVARRQRLDRANSVAVQAIIVYDQAQRTCAALLAALDGSGQNAGDAPEEMRSLANMLLTSSPSLFDDPEARVFLENVQRLTGVMFRADSSATIGAGAKPSREVITRAMDNLHASATPLVQRLSAGYRAAIEESG